MVIGQPYMALLLAHAGNTVFSETPGHYVWYPSGTPVAEEVLAPLFRLGLMEWLPGDNLMSAIGTLTGLGRQFAAGLSVEYNHGALRSNTVVPL